MKIWYFTPYDTSGNYGKACNDYCKLIQDENDWIAILDGDIMFLTSDWGKQIEDIVQAHSYAGLITCYTSRIGNLEQCYNHEISENSDIRYHRQLALEIQKRDYLQVKELNAMISGAVMIFSKKTWNEVNGFPEELSDKGKLKWKANIATVDNRYSNRILKAGKKILLAEGIYTLHYYRLNEGIMSRSHLGKL